MENGFLLKFILNFLYLPFVTMLVYLGLNKEAVVGLAVLLVIDMITGVAKEFKLGRMPRSRRFTNGIVSKVVLILIPFVLAITAKAVSIDIVVMIWVVINALILSETYSSIANIYTISTGREVEEFDAMSLILRFIRERLTVWLGDR